MAPPVAKKEDDDLIPSDPDDSDFELETHKQKKKTIARDGESDDSDDSSDDSDDSDQDEPVRKRRKQDNGSVVEEQAPVLSKEAVDDLWAQFNAPDVTTAAAQSSSTSSTKPPAPKMTTITVEYEFAGETVTQEKQVPEDSPEAKAWIARQALKGKSVKTSSDKGKAKAKPDTQGADCVSTVTQEPAAPTAANGQSGASAAAAEDALFGPASTSSSNTADAAPVITAIPASSDSTLSSVTAATASVAKSKPKPKPLPGGPRRKPAGGGLAGMAAALSGKPPKLNTLEKSKLDWNKFVSKDQALAETLDHARKDITGTGAESGYLGKQAFLGRADAAREKAWEESKKKGRR